MSDVREATARTPNGEYLPSGRSEREVLRDVREATARTPNGEYLPSGRSEREVLQ